MTDTSPRRAVKLEEPLDSPKANFSKPEVHNHYTSNYYPSGAGWAWPIAIAAIILGFFAMVCLIMIFAPGQIR